MSDFELGLTDVTAPAKPSFFWRTDAATLPFMVGFDNRITAAGLFSGEPDMRVLCAALWHPHPGRGQLCALQLQLSQVFHHPVPSSSSTSRWTLHHSLLPIIPDNAANDNDSNNKKKGMDKPCLGLRPILTF